MFLHFSHVVNTFFTLSYCGKTLGGTRERELLENVTPFPLQTLAISFCFPLLRTRHVQFTFSISFRWKKCNSPPSPSARHFAPPPPYNCPFHLPVTLITCRRHFFDESLMENDSNATYIHCFATLFLGYHSFSISLFCIVDAWRMQLASLAIYSSLPVVFLLPRVYILQFFYMLFVPEDIYFLHFVIFFSMILRPQYFFRPAQYFVRNFSTPNPFIIHSWHTRPLLYLLTLLTLLNCSLSVGLLRSQPNFCILSYCSRTFAASET